MADMSQILVIGILAVGGWYLYSTNALCDSLKLCPQGGGGDTYPRGGYVPPGGTHVYRPHGPGPYGPHRGVVGGDPAADAPYVNPGTNIGGYGDDGYGDDYGYESNAAHVSIA
jgi:hypothetical protein